MRDSQEGFIQKVMRDFAEYFNCAPTWCASSGVRASMHEVYVDSTEQLLGMSMGFQSFESESEYETKKIASSNPYNE